MLIINDLFLQFEGQLSPAIASLTCSWETPGIVALVGRSGVGKSTLLSCIAGLQGDDIPTVAAYRGAIVVDGASPLSIRGPRQVSWVPQVPALLRHLTVLGNVALPLAQTGTCDRRGADSAARALLREVGLQDLEGAHPRQLSGGMSTRVSLLRALVSEPRYLYLDEPFSSLDLSNRWVIYGLIHRMRASGELATVFASHNVPEAVLLADRIIVLTNTEGRTEAREVRNTPTLVDGTDPASCLDAARLRAREIEREVFLA